MALAHNYGSFDYKAIDPVIREVLNTRSKLDNTIQLAMPFVKATTTLKNKMLGEGNVGFTLGLHGISENVEWESMFSEQSNDLPLIGYTYGIDGAPRKVYARDFNLDLFVNELKIHSTITDLNRLPPPGITQVSIGRYRNGLLASAQLNITIPSLLQLESLQKTFLIPGVGMILEWGQQFAKGQEPVNTQYGELGLNDITLTNSVFPWHDRNKLMPLLKRLGYNNVGLSEIIQNYVYPTQGQYMWMFGRVANFSITSNADGSFESTVKIVGPSEDSWAYSTKNTVVPPKDASTTYFCSAKTNSIYSYFTETVTGPNFKTKLDQTLNPQNNSPWKNHVIKFAQGNKREGKDASETSSPITSQKSFGDLEDAYFISWRFFVNEVLNGNQNSVKSAVFANALVDSELQKVGMLLPYAHGENRTNTEIASMSYINDPCESFVGMNEYLRSVDPSVMIIVNESAVEIAKSSNQYQSINATDDIFRETDDSKKFKLTGLGSFDRSALQYYPDKIDGGFLSAGVWLNHKAVIECMIGGDTLMRGIINLLDRMNAATSNYWQLTLDTIEPIAGMPHSYNYIVMDANYRENSVTATARFIKNVHTFNKVTRKSQASGELFGSELIGCAVDLSLPKRLFSQIATLGLVQPEDLKKLNSTNPGEPENVSPKLSDPNDTIRQLFAEISTSLVASSDDEQGPDLTIPPKTERTALLAAQSSCGATNTTTTAQTSGDGQRADKTAVTAEFSKKSTEELTKEIDKANKILQRPGCSECERCVSSKPPTPSVTPSVTTTTTTTSTISPLGKKLSELTISEIKAVQKPNGTVLAVGKYQAIPATFNAWVRSEKIAPDTVFNSTTQEQLGDWLIVKKRPLVARYVNGDPSVSIETAQFQLALEFASIPVPFRVYRPPKTAGRDDPGKWVEPGESYYSGVAGNTSQNSITRYQNALRQAKETKSVQPLKEFIAKGEGGYDAINRGKAGDTVLYSKKYYSALNPTVNSPAALVTTTNLPLPTVTPVATTANTISCDELYAALGRANKQPDNPYLVAKVGIASPDDVTIGKQFCNDCARAKKIIPQINDILAAKQTYENVTRNFSGLQHILRYIEMFPDFMVSTITGNANGVFSNAFGASPGSLSISADIELPGINGIRIGELFWIDRIPSFYKIFGAFQVMSIEDVIDISGWRTKIHARFNYLGKTWKESMAAILNKGTV